MLFCPIVERNSCLSVHFAKNAEIFNDALEHRGPLELGRGVLILLQKPGKIGSVLGDAEDASHTVCNSQKSLCVIIITHSQNRIKTLRNRHALAEKP